MPWVLQILTYVNLLHLGIDLVRRVYLERAGFGDLAFNFVPCWRLPAWLFRNRLS